MNFSIQIVYEETEIDEGDVCRQCKKIIEGKKYLMMLQIGDVRSGRLHVFDPGFCKECVTGRAD